MVFHAKKHCTIITTKAIQPIQIEVYFISKHHELFKLSPSSQTATVEH